MKDSYPPLPQQRDYELTYQLAYKLAGERLARIDDIAQQCGKADARYQIVDSKKVVTLKYLNQPYLITLPEVEVSLVDSKEKVPLREKLLILHYLITAKGTPPASRLITFRELPAGNVYYPTFSKRTIKRLVGSFGQETQLLVEAAARLGGAKADYGDVAVTISAFSRVPITIVLWSGDEEFIPEGNILFDATVSDYLPTEDITVLCEIITGRLVSYLRGLKKP